MSKVGLWVEEQKFNIMIKSTMMIICILCMAAACKEENLQTDIPEAIQAMIKEIKNEEVRNPPARVFSYQYLDQTVYYIPGFCCDIMSTVYDKDGNIICHPDGGITGRGDGRCEDFFEARSEQKLIWSDPR